MLPDVTLEQFRPYQVPLFLSHALKEGWRCEEWEFRFLLENFPSGCWVARREGRVSGFITAIKYGNSGWIGNLLVRQKERGGGLGRLLMEQALTSLVDAGASTIWLTASNAGLPLYEKLGFVAVDRIVRWTGRGDSAQLAMGAEYDLSRVEQLDRLGWGDSRHLILGKITRQGMVLAGENGFCVVQVTADGFQLGPWGCKSRDDAEKLFHQALTVTGPAKVFLDIPESNRTAASILQKSGFAPCGMNILMYRGEKPAYRSEYIYALASMGSMG